LLRSQQILSIARGITMPGSRQTAHRGILSNASRSIPKTGSDHRRLSRLSAPPRRADKDEASADSSNLYGEGIATRRRDIRTTLSARVPGTLGNLRIAVRRAIVHCTVVGSLWSAQGLPHLVGPNCQRARVTRTTAVRTSATTTCCTSDYADGTCERTFAIAITGTSAGGNLAWYAVAALPAKARLRQPALAGVAVLSPVTDLTLRARPIRRAADADPLFTRPQVASSCIPT